MTKRRGPSVRLALALAVALLAAVHAASFLGAGPIDDDFIVYRYARNFASGNGLVFQPGERFEGFTVPLWVFWIAGWWKLGCNPVHVSLATSILACAFATLAVARAWQRRYPSSRWPVPALIVAAIPAFAWHGVAGLGTTTLAALLMWWFVLWEESESAGRAPLGAAVLLALACLLRQECALFALPFAFATRKQALRLVPWLPLFTLGGWTLFRVLYYERLLPLPYDVKKLELGDDLRYGLDYLWRSTTECGTLLLVLLAPQALRARVEGQATRAPERAAVLGLVLHTLYVVFVGGDFVTFARFFIPTFPLAVYFACCAVRPQLPARPVVRGALMAAALLLPQWTQIERPQLLGEHRFFEERWASLGQHFKRAVSPSARVAISPIGAFGWYSELELVDILGLTNDRLLGTPPNLEISMKGHHRHDGSWVLDQLPEYMILANGVRQPSGTLSINPWEGDLFEDPRFAAQYLHELAPIEGGAPLDVFRRRDAPALPGAKLMRR